MKRTIKIIAITMALIMLPVFALAETDYTEEDNALIIHPTIEEYYDVNAIPPPVLPPVEEDENPEDAPEQPDEFPINVVPPESVTENENAGMTGDPVEINENNIENTVNQDETPVEETETISTENEQQTEENTQAEQPAATPTDLSENNNFKNRKYVHDEEFGVLYGDTIVKLGDDPENAVEELEKQQGNEYEVDAVRTTLYTPAYKSYECDTIAIMTDDNNHESEEIAAIFVDEKGIYTRRNIQVGDPIEKVYKKYGFRYKSYCDTILYEKTYKGEKHYILFQINDDDTILSYAILNECPTAYKDR